MLLWPDVHVGVRHFWALIWFGLMGAVLLTLLGLLTSVWAEKFDHAAAVTNFVIAPLSLLSGTFYSIDNLHGTFRLISHLRSEEHTSELQSLMRISYAVFCLKKKNNTNKKKTQIS